MPQTPERREYMRRYMRRRRLASRGGRSGRGVNNSVNTPLNKRDVNNSPIPMSPVTMSKRKLVEYLAHIGERGFCLVRSSRGYELVAVGTGQVASFDAVAIVEGQL